MFSPQVRESKSADLKLLAAQHSYFKVLKTDSSLQMIFKFAVA